MSSFLITVFSIWLSWLHNICVKDLIFFTISGLSNPASAKWLVWFWEIKTEQTSLTSWVFSSALINTFIAHFHLVYLHIFIMTPPAALESAVSPLSLPVQGERAAWAGVVAAVLSVREGGHVVEACHSVVASLQHLWVGGELHGPAARPAHPHSPHVDQLGAHGAAHGVYANRSVVTITQIHTVTLHTHTCTVILTPMWFTSFINTHETSALNNIFTYTET